MKYIFLDVDRTLLDFDAYEKIAFETACNKHGITYTDFWYQRYHDINLSLWKDYEKGLIEKENLIYLRFRRLFAEMNITADAFSFESIYQKQLAEGCHYIDGAIDVLTYLAKKYNLYIVTNGVSKTQQQKIKAAGIDSYVEEIFISGEMDSHKPQKSFFDACFAKIPGFEAANALIIGDSLTSDIKGGNNANIKTCWYNPNWEINETDAIVDIEIADLRELMNIL